MSVAPEFTRQEDFLAKEGSLNLVTRRVVPRFVWLILIIAGLPLLDRFALFPWRIDSGRLFLKSVSSFDPNLSCCGGYHGYNTRALGGNVELLNVQSHFYTKWLNTTKGRLARSVVLVETNDRTILFLEAEHDIGPYWVVVHTLNVSSNFIKILALEREDLSGGDVYGSIVFGWEDGKYFQRTAMLHERVQYVLEKAFEFPPVGMN
jgi:hypothetical protein